MSGGGIEGWRRVSRPLQARSACQGDAGDQSPQWAGTPVRCAQGPAAAERRVSTHVCYLVVGPPGQTAKRECLPALASCEVPQQQRGPAALPGGALSTTHPLLLERDVRHSLRAHGAAAAPPAGRPNGAHSRAAWRAALPRAAARGQQRGGRPQVRRHGQLQHRAPAKGGTWPCARHVSSARHLRGNHGGCGAITGAAAGRREAGKQQRWRGGARGEAAGCAGAPPPWGALLPARRARDTQASLPAVTVLCRSTSRCERSAPEAATDGCVVVVQVIGMAGSGKTSFMQRMNAHHHAKVRACQRRVPAQRRLCL